MTQNVMSGYYGQPGQPYQQPADPNPSLDSYMQQGMVPDMGSGILDSTMTVDEGQTLDQIISQNELELQRRRSTYQPNFSPDADPQSDPPRSSGLEFGPAKHHPDEAEFPFDPSPPQPSMSNQMSNPAHPQKISDPRRIRSREGLALDTRFNHVNATFSGMPNYSPAMITTTPLDLDPTSRFLSNMDIAVAFEHVGADRTPLNLPGQMERPMYTSSPTHQPTFSPMFRGLGQESPVATRGQSLDQSLMNKVSRMGMPDPMTNMSTLNGQTRPSRSIIPIKRGSSGLTISSPPEPLSTMIPGPSSPYGNGVTNGSSVELLDHGLRKAPDPKFATIYAPSGFDMLGVLMQVATRPKPEINIGPVDLSCAFVVCDIDEPDMPIVYCSEVFERLTLYTKKEILQRNCRFLQAPHGNVQPGVRRKWVDDSEVFSLKKRIARREEIQLSLINHRKGGQPFMNVLTMIPVTWGTPEFKYYVGFQVDLVEHPNSVAGRNPDGTYAINYQRSHLPSYGLKPPDTSVLHGDLGQTIGRDEVSDVLTTISSGESELSKRVWDKVLLENSDDVVHVLSLKGLFLYLSPASRKVLEYDASELVGTPLSSVCHPSDIVPVTRELKDTSSGAAVNVVFRIRRKVSGYTWFESHGCLHTEQGKGRKCIIMVGRERPVYAISRNQVTDGGGIGDSELWTKMSTTGMFLFVSSNSRALLDRSPAELVGTSIQAMMREDSKKEFGRVLELARTGKKAITFKHEMQNRRGQVLQAQTTIHAGDADEGSKPTFLVAQTRFVKMSRTSLLASRSNLAPSPRTDQASVGSGTSSATNNSTTGGGGPPPPKTPQSTTTTQSPHQCFDLVLSSPQQQQGPGPVLCIGNQAEALASEDNIFDELKTTRSTSWQFELRQMEKQNRILIEELQGLLSRRKKRKRRKGFGQLEKDCANCHSRVTPEWRRGPSGRRDLCNSCGLRWAKQNGRVSPRKVGGEVLGAAVAVGVKKREESEAVLKVEVDPVLKAEAGARAPRPGAVVENEGGGGGGGSGSSTTTMISLSQAPAVKKMPKLEPAVVAAAEAMVMQQGGDGH